MQADAYDALCGGGIKKHFWAYFVFLCDRRRNSENCRISLETLSRFLFYQSSLYTYIAHGVVHPGGANNVSEIRVPGVRYGMRAPQARGPHKNEVDL